MHGFWYQIEGWKRDNRAWSLTSLWVLLNRSLAAPEDRADQKNISFNNINLWLFIKVETGF
jgi:hypothetical protein